MHLVLAVSVSYFRYDTLGGSSFSQLLLLRCTWCKQSQPVTSSRMHLVPAVSVSYFCYDAHGVNSVSQLLLLRCTSCKQCRPFTSATMHLVQEVSIGYFDDQSSILQTAVWSDSYFPFQDINPSWTHNSSRTGIPQWEVTKPNQLNHNCVYMYLCR